MGPTRVLLLALSAAIGLACGGGSSAGAAADAASGGDDGAGGSAGKGGAPGTGGAAGTGGVTCPPLCNVYCAYGNKVDVNGCTLCACNAPPDAGATDSGPFVPPETGACAANPSGDSQCTGATPHLYVCVLAQGPSGCTVRSIGNVTDTYCCP
jgi:hypothetical protein